MGTIHSPQAGKELSVLPEALSALPNPSYTIILAWVSSHSSISGNEKADSLTKEDALLRWSIRKLD